MNANNETMLESPLFDKRPRHRPNIPNATQKERDTDRPSQARPMFDRHRRTIFD
jgi:hypothetical protein